MAKATKKSAAATIDLQQAKRFWHRRQGLAEPQKGALEDVVARSGWGRTLGGIDVYIATRARVPSLTRAQLEKAVGESRLQAIPCVRGCIYMVPRQHAALGLKIAEELARKRIDTETAKAGFKSGELAQVGKEVLKALKKGPLSTDALKKALPEGTVRSLGEQGKKLGISSTLPPSLRVLEFDGAIERTPEDARLDHQDYLWRVPAQNPFASAKLPGDAAARHAALARIFAEQAGPVTAHHFACWSGLNKTQSAAAFEKAGLVPVAVEGYADDAFVREEDLPELTKADRSEAVSFLSFEDGFLTLHGGPGLMADPKHHGLNVESWGAMGKATTLGDAKHLATRTIVVGETLAGYWEYDLDTKRVVAATFDAAPPARAKAIREGADALAGFITDQMGHAKSFSLDNDKEIRKRLGIVKTLKVVK
jgi:hypothetical protein